MKKQLMVRVVRKALDSDCVLLRPPDWYWKRCKKPADSQQRRPPEEMRA